MSETPESVSIGGRIDQLCDRFEAAWRAGQAPRIEDYLGQVPAAHASYLLGELLFLELEYRQRAGHRLTLGEYQARFAEYDEVVGKVFADFLGWSSARLRRSSLAARISSQLRRRAEAPEAAAGLAETAPRVVGNYVLLDMLGRGAMGVVYRALQRNIGRIVALKLIRPDVLADLSPEQRREVIDRFRNETLAAAQLEHEHIVTVYEVGEADGYYFYTMQYVEGQSLAELCRSGPLENEEAAALLAPVARGVHEAHRRNILHRDLKPRNILVDSQTGRALVADFGLAKLQETGPDMTTTGDMIGSPAYMSPEQAMDSANVTAATDVYGLGATLYHTITGRPPFQSPAVVTTIGQVVFDDPLPPRRLNPAVDKDLETICLKCLEKDPRRRYRTARELAEELERYMRGEPIKARPLGPWGRAVRWCRRHPVVAGLSALAAFLALTVVAVTAVAYVQTSNALRGEAEARVQAARERDAALRAREQERRQRRLAQQRAAEAQENLEQARRAWDDFLQQVSDDPRLQAHGLETLRREFLEMTCRFYDEVLAERGDQADFREGRARAYGRLAAITAQLGATADAVALRQEAIRTYQELAEQFPEVPHYRHAVVQQLNRLAALYRETGRLGDAEAAYEQAYVLCQQLLREHPDQPAYLASLARNHYGVARLHRQTGRLEAAAWDLQTAIANWMRALRGEPDKPEHLSGLAQCHDELAQLHLQTSRYPEAKTEVLAALSIWEELARDERRIPAYQRFLADCRETLGKLHERVGQLAEAETEYAAAMSIRQQLADGHPDVPQYADQLAASCLLLAQLYEQTGRAEDAEPLCRQAVQIGANLLERYKDVYRYRANLAAGQAQLAGLLSRRGQDEEAEQLFRQAEANYETLVSSNPEASQYQLQLAQTHLRLGEHYQARRRWAEAGEAMRAAQLVLEQLLQRLPSRMEAAQTLEQVKLKLASLYLDRADAETTAGSAAAAARWRQEAVRILQSLPQPPADPTRAAELLRRAAQAGVPASK